MPFAIKRRIFEACLLSGLLYGCESWLNGDLRLIVLELYREACRKTDVQEVSIQKCLVYVEMNKFDILAVFSYIPIFPKGQKFMVS